MRLVAIEQLENLSEAQQMLLGEIRSRYPQLKEDALVVYQVYLDRSAIVTTPMIAPRSTGIRPGDDVVATNTSGIVTRDGVDLAWAVGVTLRDDAGSRRTEDPSA